MKKKNENINCPFFNIGDLDSGQKIPQGLSQARCLCIKTMQFDLIALKETLKMSLRPVIYFHSDLDLT